jgi:hypothetical protein
VEQLERLAELGTTYFILYFARAIETRSYELFAREVIPEFKGRWGKGENFPRP